MKVVFITRKFPPAVGGLEKLSYELYKGISQRTRIYLISWGRSQLFILPFFLFAFIKSIYLVVRARPNIFLLGDALLSPLGVLLKFMFGIKVVVIVAGLDITYKNKLYQKIVIPSLKKADKVISISNGTAKIAIEKGVPKEKIAVISIGIKKYEYYLNIPKKTIRKRLEPMLNLDLQDRFVIFTVGRLVKRKGHEWFIKEVMTKLDDNILYLVSGTGPRFSSISKLIDNLNLGTRIKMLGKVPNETKKYLLNSADLFIMPNVRVPGDVEGFGIVCLEASSAGLPVLAANLQGITDAVVDSKNGYLVTDQNSKMFIDKISFLSNNRGELSKMANSSLKFSLRYDWNKISESYVSIFKNL